MPTISVRGVEKKALRELGQRARRRGISLNRLIVEMLNGSVDGKPAHPPVDHNDLDDLAATWSAAETLAFEKATAPFRQYDESLWR